MNNKNIYIFTNSYLPILGGIQTVTSQLSSHLKAKGFNITVLTCLYPKNLRLTETINGIRVWRLPFTIPTGIVNKFIYAITLSCLFLIFLLKRPSTVYIHFPLEQSLYIRNLKRVFRYNIITCFHGHDVLRYDEGYDKNSLIYQAQKKLINSSIAVTACSDFLANTVNRIFNINNTISIYNGVDLSRFKELHDTSISNPPYIFAFGRLEKIKGFDILISAFAKADIPKHCRLLIAGDGTMKHSLLNQIIKMNMSSRIELIGRLNPDDIVKYSSEAIINVIPSLRESFGISVLEAIAAKRPIVASDRGGIPEIMNHSFGILCSPNEPDMKHSIEYVYHNLDKFDFSGAETYLNKFSIEKMIEKYMETARIKN